MLRTWRLLSLHVCALLVACLALAGTASAQTTALFFDSQPGDYIGQGIRRTYTTADATFQISNDIRNGVTVSVRAPDMSFWWTVTLGAAGDVPLTTGTFPAAGRFPMTYGNGLDVSGTGRGCNRLTGWFIVREVTLDHNLQATALAADFEQHCEDMVPALFGAIRYNSSVSDLVPFGGAYPQLRLSVPTPANGRVTGGGINCGGAMSECQVSLGAAATLTITATPDPGYVFTGWTGNCAGGAATTTVHVNGGKVCGALFEPAVTSAPRTFLFWDSQPGEYVGAGQRTVYSAGNAQWWVTGAADGSRVQIGLGSGGDSWSLAFHAPDGQVLSPGNYVAHSGSAVGPFAGMSISGAGRGCSRSTGRFVVLELVVASDGTIASFAADFEQHCESIPIPGLFGALRYNSSIDSVVPFGGAYPTYALTIPQPVNGRITGSGVDCGTGGALCQLAFAGATQVTLTATPDPGYVFVGWTGECRGSTTTTILINGPRTCSASFEPAVTPLPRTVMYWHSQAGDFIGGGRQAVYSPLNSRFRVRSQDNRNEIHVDVADPVNDWRIVFSAPAGQQLGVGYYTGARRYPFTPFNGLDAGGSGRGCNQLTGRFIVYELTYATDGSVERFAADFEQHCSDQIPGLYAAIRYNSTIDDIVPFGGAYPLYQLTVTSPAHGRISGNGIDCGHGGGPVCQLTLASALTFDLTASADAGYLFAGWTGDCRSGSATLALLVHGPKVCSALFEPIVAAVPRTLMYWDGEPGETIGRGRKTVFTPANYAWTVTSSGGGNAVRIVLGDGVDTAEVEIAAPVGQVLVPGYYSASRIAGPLKRLYVYGLGSGPCQSTGRFVILEIAIAPDGTVQRFAADFELHCDDGIVGLFGAIRYQSTIVEMVPFAGAYPRYEVLVPQPAGGRVTAAGLECGTNAVQCLLSLASPAYVTLTATPDPGYGFYGWSEDCIGGRTIQIHVNGAKRCAARFEPLVTDTPRTVLRWVSDPGSYIGQGRSEVYSRANSQWTASMFTGSFTTFRFSIASIGVAAPLWLSLWDIEFSPPRGESLRPGVHYVANRSSSNPNAAELRISGNGRSCTGGEFTVNEVELGPQNVILRFAADFVLTCAPTGTGVPLTGSIQYESTLDYASGIAFEPAGLRFAMLQNGGQVTLPPSPQTIRLNVARGARWTASTSLPWLRVSPFSGTGPAVLTITPDLPVGSPVPTGLARVGVGLTDSDIGRAFTVSFVAHHISASAPPFGFVDTPLQNAAGITGAIPMTGWALDDLEVSSVTICRAATAGETPIVDGNCGNTAQIYVGSGVFIEGARPDVEAAYSTHPRAERGGWGFMLLTNMLPNRGNGTFTFYVYARDREGTVVQLGTRTLTCSNASATAPFGTIDTPAQGATVSGAGYVNFGWALTPNPKSIPIDGSTLMVYVDGAAIGRPAYNSFRSDIATFFPGLANSGGAVGHRVIDTTTLLDGLHTIAWTATDSAGASSGLGSRYFRVVNGAAAAISGGASEGFAATRAADVDGLPVEDGPLAGRRGWSEDAPWVHYPIASAGRAVVRGEELDRFELALEVTGAGREDISGYLRVADRLRPLPIGSRLDRETGRFTWAPGVGFVGAYDLVFVRSRNGVAVSKYEVRVILAPKGSGHVGADVVIDTPRSQQDVAQPFLLGGWAVDRDAQTGTGIAAVHVWAYPLAGGAPVFLGSAAIGGTRPDVAAVHGERFRDAGFGVTVQGLPHGNYDLAVFAWSHVTGGFIPARTVRVTVR
jgi:hypothetical protein